MARVSRLFYVGSHSTNLYLWAFIFTISLAPVLASDKGNNFPEFSHEYINNDAKISRLSCQFNQAESETVTEVSIVDATSNTTLASVELKGGGHGNTRTVRPLPEQRWVKNTISLSFNIRSQLIGLEILFLDSAFYVGQRYTCSVTQLIGTNIINISSTSLTVKKTEISKVRDPVDATTPTTSTSFPTQRDTTDIRQHNDDVKKDTGASSTKENGPDLLLITMMVLLSLVFLLVVLAAVFLMNRFFPCRNSRHTLNLNNQPQPHITEGEYFEVQYCDPYTPTIRDNPEIMYYPQNTVSRQPNRSLRTQMSAPPIPSSCPPSVSQAFRRSYSERSRPCARPQRVSIQRSSEEADMGNLNLLSPEDETFDAITLTGGENGTGAIVLTGLKPVEVNPAVDNAKATTAGNSTISSKGDFSTGTVGDGPELGTFKVRSASFNVPTQTICLEGCSHQYTRLSGTSASKDNV